MVTNWILPVSLKYSDDEVKNDSKPPGFLYTKLGMSFAGSGVGSGSGSSSGVGSGFNFSSISSKADCQHRMVFLQVLLLFLQ
jgi:hypothetical protein